MNRLLVILLSTAVLLAVAYPPMSPVRCPPNELFLECGSACEPTCDVPDPQICTLQCILNVCQCAPGFVRSDAGHCVLFEQCPVYY